MAAPIDSQNARTHPLSLKLITTTFASMKVYAEHFAFPLPSHEDFTKIWNEISLRIEKEHSAPTIPGYLALTNTTFAEQMILMSYGRLLEQAKKNNLDISPIAENRPLRNKSNCIDLRRAYVLQDCDDLALHFLNLVRADLEHPSAYEYYLFANALQDARRFYESVSSDATPEEMVADATF